MRQPLSTFCQPFVNLLSTLCQPLSSSTNTNKTYLCEYCNKLFNHRPGKFKHEKICKQKEIVDNKIKLEIEKVKLAKAKEENIKIKGEIIFTNWVVYSFFVSTK